MTLMISGGGGGGGGATSLNGLSDVTLGLLSNGQILQYNSGSGQWENTALTGQLTYKGSFNATAGTPALTNALQGDFYVVSVAGTQFGRDWAIGDHLILNADMGGVIDNSKIDKIDNTDAVSSVNGATGVVNLYADDATLNLAGTGLVTSGTGATSTLNADVGTGANQLVQLDGSSRLPAVDGSQLTNLPAAPVDSVNGATGVVNLYADDATLNLAGTGLVTSGTGATSTLNADVGTGANQLVQLDGSSRLPAVDGSQLTNLPTSGVLSPVADTASTTLTLSTNTVYRFYGAGRTITLTTPLISAMNDGDEIRIIAPAPNITLTFTIPAGSTNAGIFRNGHNAQSITTAAGGSFSLTLNGQSVSMIYSSFNSGFWLDLETDKINSLSDVDVSSASALNNALVYNNGTSEWEAGPFPVTSVNGDTGAVNLYADNATLNLAGTGLVTSGTGATSTLNADVGTGANQLVQLDGSSRLPAVDGSQLTNLPSGGGSRPDVYTQSASFTVGDGTGTDPGAVTAAELERVYLINNGASAVTVTLPAISGDVGAGFKLQIKRLGTAAVTIDRNSEDIDDQAANQNLSVQYSSFTLVCAGAGVGWYII